MRRSTTVQGPFSTQTIRRYILLGRVRLGDRVSADGSCWQPITRWPELIPEEMRDLGTEAGRARFEAAQRAVDERAVERGAQVSEAAARESPVADGDEPRAHGDIAQRPRLFLLALAAVAAVVLLLLVVGYYLDLEPRESQVRAPTPSPPLHAIRCPDRGGLVHSPARNHARPAPT